MGRDAPPQGATLPGPNCEELIKELKKHKPETLVRIRLDDSFWKQDGFLDSKGKEIKIPKEIKEGIEHNLIIPNYWISEVEANSKEEAEKKLRDAPDEEGFRVYNNDWIVSFEDNKTEKIEGMDE